MVLVFSKPVAGETVFARVEKTQQIKALSLPYQQQQSHRERGRCLGDWSCKHTNAMAMKLYTVLSRSFSSADTP